MVMFKIILGWVQQHIAATIIVSVMVIGGVIATTAILLNGKETPKEEEKQPEVSQSVMLKEDLNFEINSELSLLSLVSEDNKVKVVSENEIVDTSTLGEKELVIKYLDNDQEKEQHFKISIVDTTKPTIEFQKELSTTAGTKIDLLKNVKVSDNSKEEIKATIEGDYNFDTEGTYNLKYVAVDSSNNRTEEEFVLKVNKKQTKPSNNNSNTSTSTNNNSNANNNTSNNEKPSETTPPKPADPLKAYCDNHIAGYSNESGVCVNLYPGQECSYSGTCFGTNPDEFDSWEDFVNWANENAKKMCTSRGYGWTNALDSTFGHCTW